MLTDNTVLVLVVAGVLMLLAAIQLFLAVRYDRAVAAAGPIEELAVYDKRLEEKQRLIDDLEDELAKRREAIAVSADLQAEVDGLRRQKEELLAEWESMRERREEVAAVRSEIEEATIERLTLEAEMGPLRAEYLQIKEKLEKAEDLVNRIETLKREHGEIAAEVEELRDTLRKLADAENRVSQLETRSHELEKISATLEGRITAQEQELGEARARVATEREALAETQTEHGRIGAEAAAQAQEVRRLKGEMETLQESRSSLEARARLSQCRDSQEGGLRIRRRYRGRSIARAQGDTAGHCTNAELGGCAA